MKKFPTQFLITDTKTIDPIAAAQNLPKNSAIILRDYDLPYDEKIALGKALKKIARENKFLFLVANDFKLALKLNADGMHFSEFALSEMRRIKAKNPSWFITSAAHSPLAVIRAYNAKADAVLISPVFKTASHPEKQALGIIRSIKHIYKYIPAYALGGVKPQHMKALRMAGFCGFATISGLNNCGD